MNEYLDHLCPACKFYGWDEEWHRYRCFIKGCFDGSKFVEFTIESMLKEIEDAKVSANHQP